MLILAAHQIWKINPESHILQKTPFEKIETLAISYRKLWTIELDRQLIALVRDSSCLYDALNISELPRYEQMKT